MIDTVPDDIVHFLESYTHYIIAGHREPDGDCIGSQIVLARILEARGKKCSLVSPGPFVRPEIIPYEDLFSTTVDSDLPDGKTALIVVDSSTFERLGSLTEELTGYPTAVIDHHSSGEEFGTVRWVETRSPSTTYLIFHLAHTLGQELKKEEAELLFFGLATDTGFFRHLEEKSESVFEMTGRLVAQGVSPKKVYHAMYGGRDYNSRVLLGRLLSRTERYHSHQLLVTSETLEETLQYGIENRDSESLYMFLQTVKEAEVVALIREEKPGECSVGLRSRTVDVGAVARDFGGGGHALAAGFTWYGTTDDIRNQLISAFSFLTA